jgi:tRNA G46 methylase TrmB
LPENVQQKLAKLRTQGSLTIITDHKVYHPCQAGAHEDQSQERSIVAGDDQAQGSASTPQDASFVDPSSAAEPEIIEATDQDASFVDPSSAAEPEIIEATDPDQ